MAEMTPEKMAAQEDVADRTEWERQRIEYYLRIRYDFRTCDVDTWLDTLYNQQKRVYKAKKDPSWNQVRKGAGIGFLENAFAFVSEDQKREIKEKKEVVRKELQEEVDKANAAERKRCNVSNARLNERLKAKLDRLTSFVPEDIEEYFTFALNQDTFILEGYEYHFNYNLVYDPDKKQLIIDCNLPSIGDISRIKEWKADKNNELVPKEMNKTDFLEMYERILFDISLRVVGVLFESDTNHVLRSIIFNGSCVYNDWQENPTIILSFEIQLSQYSYDRIRRMDCISKSEIARLKDVRYLADITTEKPPSDLWETPPSKLVTPIRSSWG